MAAIIWLVLGVVLAIAEAFTLTFVLLMVAAGAFAAAVAAAVGAPVLLQGVVFAVVSAAALAAVRPTIRKFQLQRSAHEEPIGIAALEGSDALVLEPVDAHHGLVRVSGEEWTARSFDTSQSFGEGEHVQIIKIKGATALVWRMP